MSTFVQIALAVFYIVRVLVYDPDNTVGPFPSEKRYVYDESTHKARPVNLFDWFRRIPGLNLYYVQKADVTVDDELWVVRHNRTPVWSCPTCLSFWATLAITVPMLLFSKPRNLSTLAKILLIHLSATGASAFIHNYLESQYGMSEVWGSEEDGLEDGV